MWKLIPSNKSDRSSSKSETHELTRPDSPLSGTSSVLAGIRFRSESDTDKDSDANGDSGRSRRHMKFNSEHITPALKQNTISSKTTDYTDPCCRITCCTITCTSHSVKNIKVLIFLNIFPVYTGQIHKISICSSVGKLRSSKVQSIEMIISPNVNFLKSHYRYCTLWQKWLGRYSLLFRSTLDCL